ncbi:MAG: hypothetical protein HW380_3240 [Magnetococcales bacterium]|nr:hypothetical protein [Magnetococcales bacterium]
MLRMLSRMVGVALLCTLWSCQTKGPAVSGQPTTLPVALTSSVASPPKEEKVDKVVVVPGASGKSLVGASMEDLQRTLGPPASIIDATVTGRAASEAWIYAPRGKSSCMDTYVVGEVSKKVEEYFCR